MLLQTPKLPVYQEARQKQLLTFVLYHAERQQPHQSLRVHMYAEHRGSHLNSVSASTTQKPRQETQSHTSSAVLLGHLIFKRIKITKLKLYA